MNNKLKEELQRELVDIHLGEIYQESEMENIRLFLKEKKEKQIETIWGVIDDDVCPEDKVKLTDEDIKLLTSEIVIGLRNLYDSRMSGENLVELMHDLINDFAQAIDSKEYEESKHFEDRLQSAMKELKDKQISIEY